MNVIGTYHWNDRGFFNDQRNDPLEELYRKLIDELKKVYPGVHRGYLESCGPNAMANALGSTMWGRERYLKAVKSPGGFEHQLPHLIIGYLNDPRNYEKMKKIRDNLDPRLIQGNRVPQYYPLVARELIGVSAYFDWGCTFDKVKSKMILGRPVQICFRNPGHYVSVKGYDVAGDALVYDDSASTTGDGFSKVLRRDGFSNIQDWLVWYDIQ